MKNKILFTVMFLCAMFANSARAQVDPHFSQYYAYPLWLNPALAGVIDGDYRLTGNYRNQWANFGNPYSTAGVSFDAPTKKNLGLGITALNMSAGDAGYNYFNAMATVSYSGVKMGKNGTTQLVAGIQAGVINRRVDQSKFQLGSQYNPVMGFDPSIPSGETLRATSSTVFDANAGLLLFDGNPNHRFNPFIGVAGAHLTQPEDPFVAEDQESRSLPIRYTVHGGSRIRLTDMVGITPHGLYMRQGNAEEIVAGVYSQIRVNLEFDLLLGANYRINDAISPFAGFHYKNFTLGLSYDANTSNLRRLTKGSNAFEISLSFIGRKRRIMQPEYFICPRL
ncbi:PorP/SprF family type IX secretion system membrane protein [Chitinophaga barathri]|uniref:Type IX secretion system membrane protein PorP/SprF n=1 Tax=Chitinophaga barathri TaxID=1647451 RepID=A0A3N4M4F7_9BACT|nr:PorP/SprF family type IX secretion system membrane protein [Chitinophaga barathri]RPD37964.1 type IX secretion system membrane protein PorP/SprF [Chitinophaga barathri]